MKPTPERSTGSRVRSYIEGYPLAVDLRAYYGDLLVQTSYGSNVFAFFLRSVDNRDGYEFQPVPT